MSTSDNKNQGLSPSSRKRSLSQCRQEEATLVSNDDKKSDKTTIEEHFSPSSKHKISDQKWNDQLSYSTIDSSFRNNIETFVQEIMSKYDGSHDFYHVLRVRKLALYIGRCEKMSKEELELVEICALLHDVFDHKYKTPNVSGKDERLHELLVKHGCSEEYMDQIHQTIDYVSYSKEQKSKQNPSEHSKYLQFLERNPACKCVQDADRLDAIGAIGIARTFCFGGSRQRSLFNFVKDERHDVEHHDSVDDWIESGKAKETTLGHFFDKLLLLIDLMKTETGKTLAKERHDFMDTFLQNFFQEWIC